jgi:hypothetical protein
LRLDGTVLTLFLQLGFTAHASLCLVWLGVVIRESSCCTLVHFLQPCVGAGVPRELRIGTMIAE